MATARSDVATTLRDVFSSYVSDGAVHDSSGVTLSDTQRSMLRSRAPPVPHLSGTLSAGSSRHTDVPALPPSARSSVSTHARAREVGSASRGGAALGREERERLDAMWAAARHSMRESPSIAGDEGSRGTARGSAATQARALSARDATGDGAADDDGGAAAPVSAVSVRAIISEQLAAERERARFLELKLVERSGELERVRAAYNEALARLGESLSVLEEKASVSSTTAAMLAQTQESLSEMTTLRDTAVREREDALARAAAAAAQHAEAVAAKDHDVAALQTSVEAYTRMLATAEQDRDAARDRAVAGEARIEQLETEQARLQEHVAEHDHTLSQLSAAQKHLSSCALMLEQARRDSARMLHLLTRTYEWRQFTDVAFPHGAAVTRGGSDDAPLAGSAAMPRPSDAAAPDSTSHFIGSGLPMSSIRDAIAHGDGDPALSTEDFPTWADVPAWVARYRSALHDIGVDGAQAGARTGKSRRAGSSGTGHRDAQAPKKTLNAWNSDAKPSAVAALVEASNWLPGDVATLASAFYAAHEHVITEGVFTTFLRQLHAAWIRRHNAVSARIRARYADEIAQLRRRVTHRDSYREVLQAATIARMSSELQVLRCKLGVGAGVTGGTTAIVAPVASRDPSAAASTQPFMSRVHMETTNVTRRSLSASHTASGRFHEVEPAAPPSPPRARTPMRAPLAVALSPTRLAVQLLSVPGSGAKRLDASESAALFEDALHVVESLRARVAQLEARGSGDAPRMSRSTIRPSADDAVGAALSSLESKYTSLSAMWADLITRAASAYVSLASVVAQLPGSFGPAPQARAAIQALAGVLDEYRVLRERVGELVMAHRRALAGSAPEDVWSPEALASGVARSASRSLPRAGAPPVPVAAPTSSLHAHDAEDDVTRVVSALNSPA